MTFEEKVAIIRSLPQFRVAPINEIRGIAFAAKNEGEIVLSQEPKLAISKADLEQIYHEYPHLKDLFEE